MSIRSEGLAQQNSGRMPCLRDVCLSVPIRDFTVLAQFAAVWLHMFYVPNTLMSINICTWEKLLECFYSSYSYYFLSYAPSITLIAIILIMYYEKKLHMHF